MTKDDMIVGEFYSITEGTKKSVFLCTGENSKDSNRTEGTCIACYSTFKWEYITNCNFYLPGRDIRLATPEEKSWL